MIGGALPPSSYCKLYYATQAYGFGGGAMVVFISYAHDGVGRPYASMVRDRLVAAGVDVSWDEDLVTLNPSSIQEWMEGQVGTCAIVCVCTPEYAQRFGHGSRSDHRRGVLYESRAIELRLHEHTESGDCPVIPVLPCGQPTSSLPPALRRLVVTRLALDGSGLDEVLARVIALSRPRSAEQKVPMGSTTGLAAVAPQQGEEVIRMLLAGLEQARGGTTAASAAIEDWLRLAEAGGSPPPSLFARGFADAERIAKSAGDLDLMRRISQACLSAVRGPMPRLRSDLGLEARVLVCGEGWYLQRTHRLREALESTRAGVRLAEQVDDRRTQAFGKKCLGRLERLTAEYERRAAMAVAHLERSQALLAEAREMFFGIDGALSEEAGDCLSLEGRTWLYHHQLTGDVNALGEARGCAARAGELIPPNNSKDYWDLVILNAELESVDRRHAAAQRLLNEAIERLEQSPDGARSEILARAYGSRAAVVEKRHNRADLVRVLRDLTAAEQIYQQFGQDHLAAEYRWRRALVDPASVTDLQLSRVELEELERLRLGPPRWVAGLAGDVALG